MTSSAFYTADSKTTVPSHRIAEYRYPPAFTETNGAEHYVDPDTRPLPEGWTAHYDPSNERWVYIRSNIFPATMSLTHPLDPVPSYEMAFPASPVDNHSRVAPVLPEFMQENFQVSYGSSVTTIDAAPHTNKPLTFAQQLYASAHHDILPHPPKTNPSPITQTVHPVSANHTNASYPPPMIRNTEYGNPQHTASLDAVAMYSSSVSNHRRPKSLSEQSTSVLPLPRGSTLPQRLPLVPGSTRPQFSAYRPFATPRVQPTYDATPRPSGVHLITVAARPPIYASQHASLNSVHIARPQSIVASETHSSSPPLPPPIPPKIPGRPQFYSNPSLAYSQVPSPRPGPEIGESYYTVPAQSPPPPPPLHSYPANPSTMSSPPMNQPYHTLQQHSSSSTTYSQSLPSRPPLNSQPSPTSTISNIGQSLAQSASSAAIRLGGAVLDNVLGTGSLLSGLATASSGLNPGNIGFDPSQLLTISQQSGIDYQGVIDTLSQQQPPSVDYQTLTSQMQNMNVQSTATPPASDYDQIYQQQLQAIQQQQQMAQQQQQSQTHALQNSQVPSAPSSHSNGTSMTTLLDDAFKFGTALTNIVGNNDSNVDSNVPSTSSY